jgi:hypothetical protein
VIKAGRNNKTGSLNTLSTEVFLGKEPINIGGFEWYMSEFVTSADSDYDSITPTIKLTLRCPAQAKYKLYSEYLYPTEHI